VIKIILKQLLGCLNYLKTLKIVHRDLKLENVAFIKKVNDNTNQEEIEIKLLDFGTAFKMHKHKIRCTELVGTISYMPPEIIKGYFTEACDLWSCGVIFYILLTSKSPFRCKNR
jgi:serine/threonine protein kinase